MTIHHGYYRFATEPWEYEEETLWVLCWPCHQNIQERLSAIQYEIGTVHPLDLEKLSLKVADAAFEYNVGVTKEEAQRILEEEEKAQSAEYADYSISILSSSELGPSKANEIAASAEERFPGVETNIIANARERDGASTVEGPDKGVREIIQKWCDAQN